MVGFPPSLAHLKTTLLTKNYHKNTDTKCTDFQAEERVLRDRRGRVSGPLRPQRETGTVSKELHDVFSSLLFCPLGFALPDLSQKDLGLFWSLKPNKSFLNYLNRTFTLVFPTAWKCPEASLWGVLHISTLNIHKDINTQAFGDGQNLLSIKKHEMAVIAYLLLFLLGLPKRAWNELQTQAKISTFSTVHVF